MQKISSKNNDENSKIRILNTAIKLFAQKGFNGTSIREICREANANICMISYFWGGKKELYQGIIDNLIETQTRLFSTIIDLNSNPRKLSKTEQVETLKFILNKVVDFFYSNISNDLIIFLIKEQQNNTILPKTPAFKYLNKLIASILNKNENDKIVIFKCAFLISQINSSRILPALTLQQFGQNDFNDEDIKIIKDNLNSYIDLIVRESENV